MSTVTERDIRAAHAAGLSHADTDTIWSYYTPILQAAYNHGWDRRELGDVVECSRLGKLPEGLSHNYRDDVCEWGISCIRAGDDSAGAAGAKMFMGGRNEVTFRGVILLDRRGSDGEPLVLPVDHYDNLDAES